MTSYHPHLVEVAWASTVIFVVVAGLLSKQPVLINGAFVTVVGGAFIVYSSLIDINPFHLLNHFYEVLLEPRYIDHSLRSSLLLFWVVDLAASILFVLLVAHSGRSSSIHRKFFHLTLSLVFLSGLLIDGPLLALSAALLLSIFIILELFRYHSVPPWGETLNKYLQVFRDHQDGALLLTPLYLLAGVCLPIVFHSPPPPGTPSPIQLFAGVISVGVGDSVAALVGSTMGRHRWPRRKKTIEGSIGMFLSMIFALLFLRPYSASSSLSLFSITIVSIVLTALEAFLANVDNIVLPLVGYALLSWFV
ncbi:dolk-1 [Pristionchus pacificus]|nr:dolk-1 [Pristionchus pacificus]